MFLVAVFLAWKAREAFVDMLIAVIIAVSLFPAVEKLKQWLRISHGLSVLLMLALFCIPIFLLGYILTPLITQGPELFKSMVAVLTPLGIIPESLLNFNIGTYIETHTVSLLTSGATALSLLLSSITIVILAFYFIYDARKLSVQFLDLLPDTEEQRAKELLLTIAEVTGKYIRGNVLISFICFVVVLVALLVLKVPYAVQLALIAGVLDLLPLVGSTLGAVPAVLIAFGVSPVTGIIAVLFFTAYQQLESAFISPIIYNKALNISSTISFVSVIIGASLFGILGAFLSLPVAASIPVLVGSFQKYR